MKFEMWNPVPILVNDLSEEMVHSIDQKVFTWTNSNMEHLVTSKEENLITSYHASHNLLEICDLTELRQVIVDCAAQFTINMGMNLPKGFKIESWINFFVKNQSEHEHTHYGNFLSGCYYVNAPEGSGVFAFPDPVRERQMWRGIFVKEKQEENFLNVNSCSYIPQRGRLLMFQSWMPHSVLKNNSDEPRISIAFNINPVS